MEHNIQMTGGELAAVHYRGLAAEAGDSVPDLSVPDRGTAGPRHIGAIMEPLRRIIDHPDRNRLMAAFCKLHW